MGILIDETRWFLVATAPEHDAVQAEMTAYAGEHGFPIIDPKVGDVLRILAHLADVMRLFGFGSGLGYSVTWFAEGTADNTEPFLTEHGAHELDMAREFLDRAGSAGRTVFLESDAFDLFEGVNSELDLVLLDHQKYRYAEAFDLISDHVTIGGVVVADNMMRGPINFGAFTDWGEGRVEAPDGTDANTRGIAAFLDVIWADPRYETIILPVGSGLVVSTRAK